MPGAAIVPQQHCLMICVVDDAKRAESRHQATSPMLAIYNSKTGGRSLNAETDGPC